jgi:hypothetical protein
MTRDYTAIGNWCVDAHSLTASELPENVARYRVAAIQKFIGKPGIVEIARDLAEGLNCLPPSQGTAAQNFLVSKHGFGFDYFIGRDLLKLAKIVARGK